MNSVCSSRAVRYALRAACSAATSPSTGYPAIIALSKANTSPSRLGIFGIVHTLPLRWCGLDPRRLVPAPSRGDRAPAISPPHEATIVQSKGQRKRTRAFLNRMNRVGGMGTNTSCPKKFRTISSTPCSLVNSTRILLTNGYPITVII